MSPLVSSYKKLEKSDKIILSTFGIVLIAFNLMAAGTFINYEINAVKKIQKNTMPAASFKECACWRVYNQQANAARQR